MWGTSLRSSLAVGPRGPNVFPEYQKRLSKSKKTSFVHCQKSGSPVTKTCALIVNSSSSLTTDLMVKDRVPYNTSSPGISKDEDGIGIVKFLRGTNFFVTGATGFLAKVLIEKLLRTQPDTGKIYVLIRAKSKDAALKRLRNEIINTEVFKCFQQIHGKSYEAFMISKLILVVGNICDSNLGMDESCMSIIAKDVDVIVNSAANTNFHERYDVAVDINTVGPGRVMAFAKKCKKLKLFLQFSTTYVNGQRQGQIMERPFINGEGINVENVVNRNSPSTAALSAKAFDPKQVSQKMKELGLQRARIYGWQDTYMFTKAMGEMLLSSVRGDVPVVILRPSVIESTYREPFPGWIEGNRTMDPVVTYYGKGLPPVFPVDPNGVLDIFVSHIPVDMVVNAIIAVMAMHGTLGKSEISVYQIASSVVNPLVYGAFTKCPCLDAHGRPIKSHIRREITSHINSSRMPSPNGKHSGAVDKFVRKAMEQAKHLASVYEPYCFYGGRFDNSNTSSLLASMSKEEQQTFYLDVGNIDWTDYICNVHIPGLRTHVMKGRRQSS
ncbi:hypothetical protein RND81_09G114600 [Saponaria officinalis]|uniref:Fatty acyl-CoA reductase n=1 Tax=Saponaria officinalis TaxID=3572 RepID=A0AAW1IKC5_SAPOF